MKLSFSIFSPLLIVVLGMAVAPAQGDKPTCAAEKWIFLKGKLEKDVNNLYESTEGVALYLEENTVTDPDIKKLVGLVYRFGEILEQGYSEASDEEKDDVLSCTPFAELGDEYREIHKSIAAMIRRRLRRAIKESLPTNNMESSRHLQQNELDQLLRKSLQDTRAIVRDINMMQAEAIFTEYWGDQVCVVCTRTACTLCEIVEVLANLLDAVVPEAVAGDCVPSYLDASQCLK